MTTWAPGQRRLQQRALETPFEGVPEHLAQPLVTWARLFLGDEGLLQRLLVDFRMASHSMNWVTAHCWEDANFHLDVIEFLLETQCARELFDADYDAAEELERLLLTGNSVYKVREDHAGLEMRTTPEVQNQVQAVVSAAYGSPGDHLANAWNEAYSRASDPVKSYSESIKAVEAALAPVISPANSKATLGTMISDVTNKPSKWQFAIAGGNVGGVEAVLQMMRVLWNGQTSRHGGLSPTRQETAAEAQAAVHLAAALVQYGVSGALSLA